MAETPTISDLRDVLGLIWDFLPLSEYPKMRYICHEWNFIYRCRMFEKLQQPGVVVALPPSIWFANAGTLPNGKIQGAIGGRPVGLPPARFEYGYYVEGRLHGPFSTPTLSGCYQHGLAHGEFTWTDRDRRIVRREIYIEGRLISAESAPGLRLDTRRNLVDNRRGEVRHNLLEL